MPEKQGTIVVPVYNEGDAVEQEICRLLDAEFLENFELIVVDDGSTDGTTEKLESLRDARPDSFTLLAHETNRGYGAALKTGIFRAASEHIIITDADNSYPNDRIPELFEIYREGGYDMVVGARVKENVAIPLTRRPAKWLLRVLANYLTRTKIPDLNSGLRIFDKRVILDQINLICDGFSFTTTLTLIMLCESCRVRYVPIEYYTRSGRSKIRPFRDMMNFIYLIFSTVIYFRPLRVLIPVGLPVLLFGVGLAVYQAVALRNITTVTVVIIQTGFYLLTVAMLADMISKNRKRTHVRNLRDR